MDKPTLCLSAISVKVEISSVLVSCDERSSCSLRTGPNRNYHRFTHSSVHNHENAISQANSKLKLEIKLPEIPLPVFRGRYDEWPSFKSQFDNVITNNNDLNESQKLYYLKASLQGDAKLLEAVDDSFESRALITASRTRFENKRLLTETHINAILEIEKLTSKSARDIRSMTDILNKNIRALKLLGFERNNLSDLLLLNIILKNIDRETRKQFEQSIDSHQIPELDTFIMFLEKRSQTIDIINRSTPIIHKQKQVTFNKSKIFLNSNDSSNSCTICKLPHLIYKCSAYQNMKVSDRFNQIKRLNLCINCLKEHRKIKECKSKNSCSVCKKRHHTSLHIFEAIPSPLPTTANELEPPPDMQGSTPPVNTLIRFRTLWEKRKAFYSRQQWFTSGGQMKLWVLKLEWDEPLSNPIAKEWNDFVSTHPVIQNIHVPRLVIGKGRIIIHGFADASTAAYSAVLYAQSISEEDVSTRLLCSKSRVAQVKPITIPRLELCACVLLSQLLEKVLHSLTLPIQQIMLWTDSNIV
ncbi:integrase catalytic domain-containing protein [Trichonephila inaurata madagascariensis]|uniref:Integrase catalytic domain-containing protein n=1 Tax=Trichonephila inaurata madagascariensis TaxID=2747483 RepID=A0A8X7BRE8_9ARAC|nr:integrase catalytic domain-containing protein [Trichonephila inaurata madagascariensis]